MTPGASMRRPAVVALALDGVLMAGIGFFPTPVDDAAHPWIMKLLGRLHERGGPGGLTYELIEFCANIALLGDDHHEGGEGELLAQYLLPPFPTRW